MACGVLTTLALTATLLGQQSLKLVKQVSPPASAACADAPALTSPLTSPLNANASLKLKDARGIVVLETKILVPRFDFYDLGKGLGKADHAKSYAHDDSGGLHLAKSAVLLFNYPTTLVNARAVTVEIKTFDGLYSQAAALKPLLIENPAIVNPALTLSLK